VDFSATQAWRVAEKSTLDLERYAPAQQSD